MYRVVAQFCISAYTREQRAHLMTRNHGMIWHEFSVFFKGETRAKGNLCSFFQGSSEGTFVCNGRLRAFSARGSHTLH